MNSNHVDIETFIKQLFIDGGQPSSTPPVSSQFRINKGGAQKGGAHKEGAYKKTLHNNLRKEIGQLEILMKELSLNKLTKTYRNKLKTGGTLNGRITFGAEGMSNEEALHANAAWQKRKLTRDWYQQDGRFLGLAHNGLGHNPKKRRKKMNLGPNINGRGGWKHTGQKPRTVMHLKQQFQNSS
jgi:hypothetical protein